MKKFLGVFTAILALSALQSASAQTVTFYTDRAAFEAQLTYKGRVDFEGIYTPPGINIVEMLETGGLTFTAAPVCCGLDQGVFVTPPGDLR